MKCGQAEPPALLYLPLPVVAGRGHAGQVLDLVGRITDEAHQGGSLAYVQGTAAQGGHVLEASVQAGLELGDAEAVAGLRGLGLVPMAWRILGAFSGVMGRDSPPTSMASPFTVACIAR